MAFIERHANEIIAATIRTRICLHVEDDLLVLHEGKIAEEFGVSRTPIRQVFQSLAHEHLVQTRPGIGTIATPLDEGMFERDLTTAHSMLQACAVTCLHPTPKETRFALAALLAMAREAQGGLDSRGAFVEVAMRLRDILVPVVTDPLVANAYTSSYWRIIRWRVRMFERDPNFTWDRMIGLIEVAASGAAAPDHGAIFQQLADRARSKTLVSTMKIAATRRAPVSNVQNIR